jgi:hypothetical protein
MDIPERDKGLGGIGVVAARDKALGGGHEVRRRSVELRDLAARVAGTAKVVHEG